MINTAGALAFTFVVIAIAIVGLVAAAVTYVLQQHHSAAHTDKPSVTSTPQGSTSHVHAGGTPRAPTPAL